MQRAILIYVHTILLFDCIINLYFILSNEEERIMNHWKITIIRQLYIVIQQFIGKGVMQIELALKLSLHYYIIHRNLKPRF